MKRDPKSKIPGLNNVSIGDFWGWAYSDILVNTNRSVFAEFLVGTALDIVGALRVEWDYVDLHYKDKTIEVKSSAYMQSWEQNKPSTIKYDIEKRKHVDVACDYVPDNNGKPVRFADCYVFCLYSEKDISKKENVLDISSWEFYVLPTSIVDDRFGNQKSISLSVLAKHCNSVSYSELKNCIDSALGFCQDWILVIAVLKNCI